MNELVKFKYIGTALPGNGVTVDLFNTVTAFPAGNMLPGLGLNRIYVAMNNNQAGTLKAFQSTDRGVNWVQIVPDQAVSAAATNSENANDYLVEAYADFKLTWTNGATPQTVFTVNISGSSQRMVAN